MRWMIPFCSAGWCREALIAAGESADVRDGMVDAAAFDLTLTFDCTDRDVASTVTFAAGVVRGWVPGPADRSVRPAILRATLDTWRAAAEGERDATALLLAGKIRLKDTRNLAVAANYRVLDALVASWLHVATDWDVAYLPDN